MTGRCTHCRKVRKLRDATIIFAGLRALVRLCTPCFNTSQRHANDRPVVRAGQRMLVRMLHRGHMVKRKRPDLVTVA